MLVLEKCEIKQFCRTMPYKAFCYKNLEKMLVSFAEFKIGIISEFSLM